MRKICLHLAFLAGLAFGDGGMNFSCPDKDWAYDRVKSTIWKPANLVYGKDGVPVTAGTIHFRGYAIELSQLAKLRIIPEGSRIDSWSRVWISAPDLGLSLNRK